jgi:hypothetical protein
MGETLETEPVEMPAKKGFRDRGYSYHKYQLKKSTLPNKEAVEEQAEEPTPGIVDRLQVVFSAMLSVSSGCYSFISSLSASEESSESTPAPLPPRPSKGLKHEPTVIVIPHEPPKEEYDPGLALRDPFKELHSVSCCQDIFFAKAEEKACVVIGGQVQVPTVVDLTNGAPNKFEEDWKKKGVHFMRFDCPDKEFALDVNDVTGAKSALTTLFGDVMYLMHANRLTLTTCVRGVERDIDPIEENIWKNKRFRMVIQNKANSLGLHDDTAGQVWKTREHFAVAVRRITG